MGEIFATFHILAANGRDRISARTGIVVKAYRVSMVENNVNPRFIGGKVRKT